MRPPSKPFAHLRLPRIPYDLLRSLKVALPQGHHRDSGWEQPREDRRDPTPFGSAGT